MIPTSRRVDKALVLYGRGKLGNLAREVFAMLRIPIHAIIDQTDFRRLDVPRNSLVAVCVASVPFDDIKDALELEGYLDIVPVYDIFNAYPECGITNGWYADDNPDNFEHMVKVARGWPDKHSECHYLQFRGWRMFAMEMPFEDYPIVDNRWEIPEVTDCLGWDNSIYREHPGSTLADIMFRKMTTVKLPQRYNYIQLHVEGRELEELHNHRLYIQKVRPILGVTVYHNPDGLWRIPQWLMDNLPDYYHLFRLHAWMGQGAIHYAIPKERTLIEREK